MAWRAFIQHNFWSKLGSLVLALLLWFYINLLVTRDTPVPRNPITNRMTREFVRLPVRVLCRAGETRVFKLDPDEILVSVTGEAAILKELSSKNFAAFVDLSGFRASRETNQLVRLDIPDGVTVIRLEPRAVNVEQVSPRKTENSAAEN